MLKSGVVARQGSFDNIGQGVLHGTPYGSNWAGGGCVRTLLAGAGVPIGMLGVKTGAPAAGAATGDGAGTGDGATGVGPKVLGFDEPVGICNGGELDAGAGVPEAPDA